MWVTKSQPYLRFFLSIAQMHAFLLLLQQQQHWSVQICSDVFNSCSHNKHNLQGNFNCRKKKQTISGGLLSSADHAMLHLSIALRESIKERLQATTFYKHLHLHFSSSSSHGLLSLPLPWEQQPAICQILKTSKMYRALLVEQEQQDFKAGLRRTLYHWWVPRREERKEVCLF